MVEFVVEIVSGVDRIRDLVPKEGVELFAQAVDGGLDGVLAHAQPLGEDGILGIAAIPEEVWLQGLEGLEIPSPGTTIPQLPMARSGRENSARGQIP